MTRMPGAHPFSAVRRGYERGLWGICKVTHSIYLSLVGPSLSQEVTVFLVIVMIGINCQPLGVDHVT